MEPTLGEIRMFAGNFAPANWAFCQGQRITVTKETSALFAILGDFYGGDGRTYFNLPDLQGRVPVGEGTGVGLSSYHIGQQGGAAEAKMEVKNMPAHAHYAHEDFTTTINLPAYNEVGDSENPFGGVPAAFDGAEHYKSWDNNPSQGYMAPFNAYVSENEVMANTVGAGTPFPVYAPYIAMNYIICMKGLFPSRN
jgi:microcystin-dependent protein